MLQSHLESIFARDPDPETLRDLVSRARLRIGLSQSELAATLGVNKGTWNRWENRGERVLTDEKIAEACDILGIDPYRVSFLTGRIHPDMETMILSDWKLYDELRKALNL